MSKLLVEGKLDAEILLAVLGGSPVVEQAGPKGGLAPKARDERKRAPSLACCYLRDRDFDYEPRAGEAALVADCHVGDAVLGWHWRRHEIESYLLDPALVTAATGWDAALYSSALQTAAQAIRHYQIARWVVGTTRKALPPFYEFSTRPDECDHEFQLPADLAEEVCSRWVTSHCEAFYRRAREHLAPARATDHLQTYAQKLTEVALQTVDGALLWCSGKDLFTALTPWLKSNGIDHPSAFRENLRDWIIDHPTDALRCLPDWRDMQAILRQ